MFTKGEGYGRPLGALIQQVNQLLFLIGVDIKISYQNQIQFT